MSDAVRLPFLHRDPARPGVSLMPDAPVTFVRAGRILTELGLLDTGATVNVLPWNVGLSLGLDWDALKVPVPLAGNHRGLRGAGGAARCACGDTLRGAPRVRVDACGGHSDPVGADQLLPGVRRVLPPGADVLRSPSARVVRRALSCGPCNGPHSPPRSTHHRALGLALEGGAYERALWARSLQAGVGEGGVTGFALRARGLRGCENAA